MEQVIKLGIASEQAGKNATRLNGKRYSTGEGDERIAALEEQVRALKDKSTVVKDSKCKSCTRPFHAPGKCKGVEVECFDCGKMGHFRGAEMCKKPKSSKQRKREKVRSVQQKDEESSQEGTDSEESINRVVEEMVATAHVKGLEK